MAVFESKEKMETVLGQLFEKFDRILGLERLRLFHINDSKKGLGSRVDRHEHPGVGRYSLRVEFFSSKMKRPYKSRAGSR